MFYSLGPGFGSLITLSSYNRFNNNILRDTLIIVVGDTLHSVLAGCMVFTFLGGIAKRKNVSVLEVVQNGPALTFVVLMEALSEIGPVPQLLSFMFTLMLLVLGLDSVIAYTETLVTALTDNSKILQSNRSKFHIFVLSQKQHNNLHFYIRMGGFGVLLYLLFAGTEFLLFWRILHVHPF